MPVKLELPQVFVSLIVDGRTRKVMTSSSADSAIQALLAWKSCTLPNAKDFRINIESQEPK